MLGKESYTVARRMDDGNGVVIPGGGRLIVVSNRAPIRVVRVGAQERIEPTVGGVGTTFFRLLERFGGLWLAWSGGQKTLDRLALPPDDPRFELVFVPLSEREVSQYYYGMCSRGLWPLMHYMTPNCHFNAQHWHQYRLANRRFAESAAAEAGDADVLWVQDFQLALMPRMVRELKPKLPIGIFFHVPFPPEQVFRVLPWRREFLTGMLGCNLIGFHTRAYARHFLTCCERILRVKVDRTRGEVSLGSRTVRVGAFPLGIPVAYFDKLARSGEIEDRARRIRRALRTERIVLGVDRLDYTKGILERVLGFERFLELNPSYHRRVTLVIIAVPSRTRLADYALLKRRLDEQVGRIVGRFSSEGWVPIRYLYTQFATRELVAYYQASDVALLTPLRDGMNLVAKEYVTCHPRGDGVLILSEFTGAAEELKEALLVNPYDVDEIAARLKQALEIPPEERAEMMRVLRRRVRSSDLERWSRNFLTALTVDHPFEALFDSASGTD